MKIYRIAHTFSDAYEMVGQEHYNIVSEYYTKHRKGQKMSWSVIPYARLKKIWIDFAKTGFIRDTTGLNQIVDKMLKNLARIQAATDLAGHSQFDTEVFCEDNNFTVIDGQNWDFYYDFLDTQYGAPISDYGLDKLWDLAAELVGASDPKEQLMLVDRMLQVTHQRGDLAALFVEGGISSLTDLFLWKPEMGEAKKEAEGASVA